MKKILILIPNYNGKNFIKKTILMLKNGISNCNVLVVDDCSTDNPSSYLEEIADLCIYKPKNNGYATTVNVGLRYFIDNTKFDLVMITNSDIDVDLDKAKSISNTVHSLMSNPRIGVLGFLENSNKDASFYKGVNISGFLFVISRDVVTKVGLLDEGFYMYGEEQDYFSRVINADFEILQSNVVVKHKVESSAASPIKNSWYAIRNSILLEFKTKKILKILKKTIALFALINYLYKPKNLEDPSYIRIIRPGILLGNTFLILAVLWNVNKILLGKINE